MSDPSLHQLERDVEAARAKLAGDLSTLRSPSTYSEFTSDLKHEALDMKEALADKAKSTFEGLVDDLKARAAANPAAALVIGAGIAWRLIQRPPIATALIGAGLYSLLRTTPSPVRPHTTEGYLSQAKERLGEQAGDLAEGLKERALAMGEAATEKAAELAANAKERALAMGEATADKATELATGVKEQTFAMRDAATDKMAELADAAKDQAQQWRAQAVGNASETFEEMRRSAADTTSRAASRASSMADEWSRPLQEAVNDQETRDKLLLGAAGVAVIAALSIACQRRLSETAEAD